MRSIATAPPEVRPRAVRVGRLHAVVADAMHALLTELAGFDADEVWKADGATDMVSWLTWELGVLPRTARGWLEVAHALDDLPELRRCLATGALSLDQVRALVTIATPETEAELAEEAVHMTATEVARMVRTRRQVTKEQLEEDEAKRSVTWSWTQDDRFLHLHGTLPTAEGALVERALLRIAAEEGPLENGTYRDPAERAADALTLMASEALARDGDPDRATVVVHVSADDLAAGTGTATLEGGAVIAIETAQRLACDARTVTVTDGPGRIPIGIGRTSRKIPPWLARLVRDRDGGCRFPGCGRTRWTQIHHILHWAHGGRTDLHNLITLCGLHHRMLHNEGWVIRGDPTGKVQWVSPHGWTLQPSRTLAARHPTIRSLHTVIDGAYHQRLQHALAAPDQ